MARGARGDRGSEESRLSQLPEKTRASEEESIFTAKVDHICLR